MTLTCFRSYSSILLCLYISFVYLVLPFWSLKWLDLMLYTSPSHLFSFISPAHSPLVIFILISAALFSIFLTLTPPSFCPLTHTVQWIAGSDLRLYAACRVHLPCSQMQRRMLLLWRVTVAAKSLNCHAKIMLPVFDVKIYLCKYCLWKGCINPCWRTKFSPLHNQPWYYIHQKKVKVV